MSDLVGNQEFLFSHANAQIVLAMLHVFITNFIQAYKH